jgi:hypothetical protein
MRRIKPLVVVALVLFAAIGASAAASGWRPGSGTDCVADGAPVALGDFGYHPLVHQLDLSILAYQLHGQSLAWPFDPYYEERADVDEALAAGRDRSIASVHEWAAVQGASQVARPGGLGDFRGPGALTGAPNNVSHDPVIYRYDGLFPWQRTIVNADGRWTEYATPTAITDRIAEVWVAYWPSGSEPGTVVIDQVSTRPADVVAPAGANDVLIAFEGGTGDKGEPGQPASQSLMGFVLARVNADGGYDAHISFRGSRSGLAERALFEALSTRNASGNPDWITDLGTRLIGVDGERGQADTAATVSTVGRVHRGFATSIEAMLPTVMQSLDRVATIQGTAPNNVYVTGHSLGGALAQHFTSAVLMGNGYGPIGSGVLMPAGLTTWPWAQMKLVTFGAPRAGDEAWARPLTEDLLQSEFYDDGILPFDRKALDAAAFEIAPRLTDASQPVAYRVLISTDPITNDLFDGGKPVGKTVYVNLLCDNDPFGLPDVNAHEPVAIRDLILLATADDRTPDVAWNYLDMDVLNPTRDDAAAGTDAEFDKLFDAVASYYDALEPSGGVGGDTRREFYDLYRQIAEP